MNINGYRLDHGEVEQAIARHDEVRRVVVAANGGKGPPGKDASAVLTAFVTPATHAGDDLEHRLRSGATKCCPPPCARAAGVF